MSYKKRQIFSIRKFKVGAFSVLIGSHLFLSSVQANALENKVEVKHVDYASLTVEEKNQLIKAQPSHEEGVTYTLVYQKNGQALLPNTGVSYHTGNQIYTLAIGGVLIAGGLLLLRRNKKHKHLYSLVLILGGITLTGTVYAATELALKELVLSSQVAPKSIDGYHYIGYIIDKNNNAKAVQLTPNVSASDTTSQTTAPSTDTSSQTTAPRTDTSSQTTAPSTDTSSQTTAPSTDTSSQTTAPSTDTSSQTTAPSTDTSSQTTAPRTDTSSQTTAPSTDTSSQTTAPSTDTSSQTTAPSTDTSSQTTTPSTDTSSQTTAPSTDTSGQTTQAVTDSNLVVTEKEVVKQIEVEEEVEVTTVKKEIQKVQVPKVVTKEVEVLEEQTVEEVNEAGETVLVTKQVPVTKTIEETIMVEEEQEVEVPVTEKQIVKTLKEVTEKITVAVPKTTPSAEQVQVTYDLSADSDGDGVSNGDELTNGTNPEDATSYPTGKSVAPATDEQPSYDLTADTDGDGVSNGDELTNGTDPEDASSYPTGKTVAPATDEQPSYDLAADSDGDGVSNGDELTNGTDPEDASSYPTSKPSTAPTADELPVGIPDPEVVVETLPYQITYKADETKPVGYVAEIAGSTGTKTTTTTYSVDASGQLVATTEEVVVPAVDKVIVKGIQATEETRTTETYNTVYEAVEDTTYIAGTVLSVTEGQNAEITELIHYALDPSGQVIESYRETLKTVDKKDKVIRKSVKALVETETQAKGIEYQAEPTSDLTAGTEVSRVEGQDGVTRKTTIYTLDTDGELVPTVATETTALKNTLVTISTKPKVETTYIDFTKRFEADTNLAYGNSYIDTTGVRGEIQTTTNYRLNTDGTVSEETPQSTQTVQTVTQVEKVGAKSEVRTETIPLTETDVTIITDSTLPLGKEVVTEGEAGELTITKTYTVNKETGQVTSQETSEVTKEKRNKVIRQGSGENNVTPYTTRYEADSSLAYKETQTSQVGKAKVVDVTGQVIEAGQDEIIKVGNKEVIVSDLPITTRYEADSSLAYKAQEETAGQLGQATQTILYQVDAKTGLTTTVISNITETTRSMTEKVVKIGNKEVLETTLPKATVYQANANLAYQAQAEKTAGQDSKQVTTNLYDVNAQTGSLTLASTETQASQPLVNRVVEVGNKEVTVTPLLKGITYKADSNLNYNEKSTQEGQDGHKTLTTIYDVDAQTGNLTNPVTSVSEVAAKDTIISVGNVKVTTRPIAVTTVYVEDSTVPVGEEVVKENGQEGLEQDTTIYQVDATTGELVNGQTVTSTVTAMIPKKIARGTKLPDTVVSEKTLERKTVYKADENMAYGTQTTSEGQDGKEVTTTTYRLNASGEVESVTTVTKVDPTDTVITKGTKATVTTINRQYIGGVETVEETTTYSLNTETGLVIANPVTERVISTKTNRQEIEVLDFETVYVGDESQPRGYESVSAGQKGKKVTSTGYTVDATGQIVESVDVQTIAAKPQTITKGTKTETVVTVTESFNTVYKGTEETDKLAGEIISETPGINGQKKEQVNFTVTSTGDVVESSRTLLDTIVKQDKIITRSTKPKVETQVTQQTTEYVADPSSSLVAGSVVKTEAGQDGVVKTITTYTLDNQGNLVSSTRTENVTRKNTIVTVSTKPKVSVEYVEFATFYEADPNATYQTKTTKVNGVRGENQLSTTYVLNTSNGTVSEGVTITTTKVTKVDEVITVGNKQTETVSVPVTIKYVADATLEKGVKKDHTQGRAGSNLKTTTYTVDSSNGNLSNPQVVITEQTPMVQKEVGVGNVEKTEITVQRTTKYEDKDSLEEGKTEVKEAGRDGIKERTVTYTVNPTDGSLTVASDVTVDKVEMVPQVIYQGTKKATPQLENLPSYQIVTTTVDELSRTATVTIKKTAEGDTSVIPYLLIDGKEVALKENSQTEFTLELPTYNKEYSYDLILKKDNQQVGTVLDTGKAIATPLAIELKDITNREVYEYKNGDFVKVESPVASNLANYQVKFTLANNKAVWLPVQKIENNNITVGLDELVQLKDGKYSNGYTFTLTDSKLTPTEADYTTAISDYSNNQTLKNLAKLMPFYNVSALSEMASKLTNEKLKTAEVVSVLPLLSTGEVAKDLSKENIAKILVQYKEGHSDEFAVARDTNLQTANSFTNSKVIDYKVTDLGVNYHAEQLVSDVSSLTSTILTSYNSKLDSAASLFRGDTTKYDEYIGNATRDRLKAHLEDTLKAIIYSNDVVDLTSAQFQSAISKQLNDKSDAVLAGLLYLERRFDFNKVKDILQTSPQFYGNQTLNTIEFLAKIGSKIDLTYMSLPYMSDKFTEVVAPNLVNADMEKFIRLNSRILSTKEISTLQWWKNNSPATIEIRFRETNPMSEDELFTHLMSNRYTRVTLGLLNNQVDAVYAMVTSNAILVGSLNVYMDYSLKDSDPDKFATELAKYRAEIKNNADVIQKHFDHYYHIISPNVIEKFSKNQLLVFDKYRSKNGSWSARTGSSIIAGMDSFFNPLMVTIDNRPYGAAYNGSEIRFFGNSLLNEWNILSHELVHAFDNNFIFEGNTRRGTTKETFAQGMFESTYPTEDILGFNSIGDEVIPQNWKNYHNTDADRFKSPKDLQDYFKRTFDILYTLDVAEMYAMRNTLNSSKKSISMYFDIGKFYRAFAPDGDLGTDAVQEISKSEIREAYKTTTDDNQLIKYLVEKQIVGVNPYIGETTYVKVKMFKAHYGVQESTTSYSGQGSFKRIAFEILADKGLQEGMAPFTISDKFGYNDKDVFKGIYGDEYTGLQDFRIKKLQKALVDAKNIDSSLGYSFQSIVEKLTSVLQDTSLTNDQKVQKLENAKQDVYLTLFKATNELQRSIYTDNQ